MLGIEHPNRQIFLCKLNLNLSFFGCGNKHFVRQDFVVLPNEVHWLCSPTRLRTRAPTLLLHGTADRLVPVQNSILFYQAMLAQGRPVKMHLYDGANHGFFGYPALHQWMDDVERFIAHYSPSFI